MKKEKGLRELLGQEERLYNTTSFGDMMLRED
jgi:hypothetical protein